MYTLGDLDDHDKDQQSMSSMSTHPMSSYEARRATFLNAEGASSSRSTGSRRAASHARQTSWPHPLPDGSGTSRGRSFPSAGELANLGLFYARHPTCASLVSPELDLSAKDACRLYPEEHIVISTWSAGDDPAERIRAVCPSAAFLLINESKDALIETPGAAASSSWIAPNAETQPTGKIMNDARLKTFGTLWPYDGKKGWKPSSKKVRGLKRVDVCAYGFAKLIIITLHNAKLAQAGFHYTPNEDENDCATCQYCDVSLGGWEKTDDPIHEHQRRRPECAFFNCRIQKITTSGSTSTVKEKTASGHKRTKSASAKRKATSAEAEENLPEPTADAEAVQGPNASKKAASSVDATDTSFTSKKSVEAASIVPPARTSSRKKTKVDHPDITPLEQKEAVEEAPRVAPSMQKHEEANDEGQESASVASPKQKSLREDEMHTEANDPATPEVLPQNIEGGTSGLRKDTRAATQEGETKAVAQKQRRAVEDLTEGLRGDVESVPQAAEQQSDSILNHLGGAASDAKVEHEKTRLTEAPAKDTTALQAAVPTLSVLPPLSKEEEDMTVEAWLKVQVEIACQEMEKEGILRIGRLQDEMTRSRVEVEAILRGQRQSSAPSLVSALS